MSELSYDYEPAVEEALRNLLSSLSSNPIIAAYQQAEERIGQHDGLKQLVDDIKQYQKQAVQFAHYDKPRAEQEAIKQADLKQREFDEHPLVIDYREKLVEANDLLHHLTQLLESQVNLELEKRLTED
ncbi:YlbF family regulator [Vagococcus vulneris]|uniref:YlbF family regulator n=1 Tax=Vagococcus vulneris TaxID=1977869 RepID=A0A429ZY84_9ENTE|nr:YlbF family regulator [Vagococcus vulneris]RST98899.1 hypothetical protein CBF37_05880 [Vagococcus vulneris]